MATDPLVAKHLNTLALECDDDALKLEYHRDALKILDMNKCCALLFDKKESSREYALEMAITLSNVGDTTRRMNDFVASAEAYKECFDLFLESLIDDGIILKTKLNEMEQGQGHDCLCCDGTISDDLNLIAVSKALHDHPEYSRAVAGVHTLLREIQCAKFVSHSASSRRRRRMSKLRVTEANLKKAVESLSLTVDTPSIEGVLPTKQAKPSFKRSSSTPVSNLKRPPSIRRAITSADDNDVRYRDIATRIEPAEKALVIALKRFPAPKIVHDDNPSNEDKVQSTRQQIKPVLKRSSSNSSYSLSSVDRVDSGFQQSFDLPTYIEISHAF